MLMHQKPQSSIPIVDDDSSNRKQWKAALEGAHFQILEADNRIDALTYVEDTASGIDLLVTGVMRHGAEAQLAAEAFALRPTLPMIIEAPLANPVGIQDHLAILLEPVSDAELTCAARALLSR